MLANLFGRDNSRFDILLLIGVILIIVKIVEVVTKILVIVFLIVI